MESKSTKSIFDLFNSMIDSSKQDHSKIDRFFIPGGQYVPSSTIIGAEINTFHGSDSLQLTAVYACVSKIADTIASMDLDIERENSDGTKSQVSNSNMKYLLSVQPNELMGAYEFWQMIVSDALIYGAGYALMLPNSSEIYWLPAVEVTWALDKNTGKRFYHYPGAPDPVPQEYMLEIKAFRSLSPTRTQLTTLKTAKSIMDFGSKFFDNGGMLGGILSTKEHLSADQLKQAADRWEQEYTGRENAHKIAILGGGFNYQPLSVPLEQIQFLESKRYTTEEIARIFQVPPDLIGMSGGSSYDNYEQKVLQFKQGCILPWVKRIELEMQRKFFNGTNLRARFDVDSLLRGDSVSRAKYYHSLLSDGVLSINEVRRREGLESVDGGDNHHVQLNQIPLTAMDEYAKSIVEKGTPVTDNQAGALAGEAGPEAKE